MASYGEGIESATSITNEVFRFAKEIMKADPGKIFNPTRVLRHITPELSRVGYTPSEQWALPSGCT